MEKDKTSMNILPRAMEVLKIPPNEKMIESFYKYRDLVLYWNEKVNLTAIKDPKEFEIKHFVDSLFAGDFQGFLSGSKIIDIGTGAGFPGLPLAICYPLKQFTLVDSLNKRVKIVNEIIDALGVDNARAIHGRAEDLATLHAYRQQYDVCLSRAVSNLSVLSEYCLPFVKVGGYFGAYKSKDADEEIDAGQNALKVLGGALEATTIVELDDIDIDHQILWIRKIRGTPVKYPRKAGMPSKEPL
jgi:16S rRNA (guanine527-N7)-methyltransferase